MFLGYQTASNPYIGATVGRVCNRIANGRFSLKGQEIQVSRNLNNKHQLHGGFIGFNKVHWQVEAIHQDGITLKHFSPDGHEGYPGQVTATVKFTLTEDNCLHVQMQAETNKTTTVNMTNHTYFNLAGHVSTLKVCTFIYTNTCIHMYIFLTCFSVISEHIFFFFFEVFGFLFLFLLWYLE